MATLTFSLLAFLIEALWGYYVWVVVERKSNMANINNEDLSNASNRFRGHIEADGGYRLFLCDVSLQLTIAKSKRKKHNMSISKNDKKKELNNITAQRTSEEGNTSIWIS